MGRMRSVAYDFLPLASKPAGWDIRQYYEVLLLDKDFSIVLII